MTRETISLYIDDLSQFAKSLRAGLEQPPGQQAMLGLIARAAGRGNWQALRAQAASPVPARLPPAQRRALACFDAGGVMTRWPRQTGAQALCCWVFWSRMQPRRDYTETALNDLLKAGSSFGDHVLLRRSLIDHGLASRAADGSRYCRIEQPPPEPALAVIRAVAG